MLKKPISIEDYSHTDLSLLSLLQEDARQTTVDLALKLDVSQTTVRKRLKYFRDNDIISREIAILNTEKIGKFLYFMVDVQLAGDTDEAMTAIKRFALESPLVIQCFHMMGSSDLRLLIVARTLGEFETFTADNFSNNHDVFRFESNLVIRPVKMGFSLPIL